MNPSIPILLEEHTDTLMFILVGIIILVTLLTGVAFYRGLFRLPLPPTEPGVRFILMQKKASTPESSNTSGFTPAKRSAADDANR